LYLLAPVSPEYRRSQASSKLSWKTMNSSSVPQKATKPSSAAASTCALSTDRGDGRTGPDPSSQLRSHCTVAEYGWPGVRRRVLRSGSNIMSP